MFRPVPVGRKILIALRKRCAVYDVPVYAMTADVSTAPLISAVIQAVIGRDAKSYHLMPAGESAY